MRNAAGPARTASASAQPVAFTAVALRCRRPMPDLAVLPSRLVDPLFVLLVASAIGLWLVARPAMSRPGRCTAAPASYAAASWRP